MLKQKHKINFKNTKIKSQIKENGNIKNLTMLNSEETQKPHREIQSNESLNSD